MCLTHKTGCVTRSGYDFRTHTFDNISPQHSLFEERIIAPIHVILRVFVIRKSGESGLILILTNIKCVIISEIAGRCFHTLREQ